MTPDGSATRSMHSMIEPWLHRCAYSCKNSSRVALELVVEELISQDVATFAAIEGRVGIVKVEFAGSDIEAPVLFAGLPVALSRPSDPKSTRLAL